MNVNYSVNMDISFNNIDYIDITDNNLGIIDNIKRIELYLYFV